MEGAAARPTRLGKYELITRIGQGGMAEVQLAIQRGPAGFEKLVVVKLVHENLATQKTFIDMLLDEARVAALVKHPNVVDIYDLGEADGRYFIAMEYLEGEPLLSLLRAGREGKRLDVMSTARLIADTAEGLDAAHELRNLAGDPLELVHHDVSLGNIVVLYNGQVKLVDFGVAKATQSQSNDRRVQGKFSYMAPEKLKGSAGDRRSDIWSLGAVLWEALTLKRLFRGGNDAETMRQVLDMPLQPPSQVNGDVSAEFDPIVMRAIARNPDERYSSAKQLADGLEDLLTQQRYGARNDAIARYMQDTFKDHIIARKKLLQEVSSKGVASTEILDLAFSEPLIASGSAPGHTDFSVRFRRSHPSGLDLGARGEEPSSPSMLLGEHGAVAVRPTPRPGSLRASAQMAAVQQLPDEAQLGVEPMVEMVAREAAPRSTPMPAVPRTMTPMAVARTTSPVVAPYAGTTTNRIAVPPVPPPGPSTAAIPAVVPAANDRSQPIAITSPRLEPKRPKTEARPMEITALPPPRSRALITITVTFVVVAAAAVTGWILLHNGAGGRHRGDSDSLGSAVMGTVTTGSAGTGSAASSKPGPAVGSAAVAAPPVNAEQLYREGTKQLDGNDLQGALATLRKAADAEPSFAPTHRSLGLVFERLGERAAEKAQFVKYLQLAPRAADASAIRDKLAGL